MLLWCYFSIVFTDPGSVPPSWKPVVDEERGEADPLTGPEFSGIPAEAGHPKIRFCRKCNQLKPPRCHHCSVCGRCVLKMDHHCVWVVNCIGALNYKFFLLFLTKCGTAATSTKSQISMWAIGTPSRQFDLWHCILEALVKNVGGVGILLRHIPMKILQFYTFLEMSLVAIALLPQFIAFFSDLEISRQLQSLSLDLAYEKKTTPKWRYDLGRKRNFQQDSSVIICVVART
ncbi:hypothetical protein Ancab_011550 [Ancistrocladus abbreviatus]